MKTGLLALLLALGSVTATALTAKPQQVQSRQNPDGTFPTTLYHCYRTIRMDAPDQSARGVVTLLTSNEPINTSVPGDTWATYSPQWTEVINLPAWR